MAHKRRWRRSAITCIAGVIANSFQCNGCVRLPNFDLLIISLSVERIFVVSLQLTFMLAHIKGLMLLTWHSCHGNDSRLPLPHYHKNIRVKGYFDQNMLFLFQMSLSLCKMLILLQVKHRNFKF